MANKQIYQLTETLSVSPDDWLAIDLDSSNLTRKARVGNVFSVSEGSAYTGGTASGIMFNNGNTFATSTNLTWDGTTFSVGAPSTLYGNAHIKGNSGGGAIGNRVLVLEDSLPELWFKDTSGGGDSLSLTKYGNFMYFVRTNSSGVYQNYAGLIQLSSGKWTIGSGNNPLGQLDVRVQSYANIGQLINLANGQTADAFQINSYGNTGGDVFSIESDGLIRSQISTSNTIGQVHHNFPNAYSITNLTTLTSNKYSAFFGYYTGVKHQGLYIGANSTGSGFIQNVDGTSAYRFSIQPYGGGLTVGNTAGMPNNKTFEVNGGSYFKDNVGIGATSIDASAKFQIDSTTQGALLPRMTTTQRDAIASPATGLSIFNTTTAQPEYYSGTAWEGAAGGGISIGDSISFANADRILFSDGGSELRDSDRLQYNFGSGLVPTGTNNSSIQNVIIGHNAGSNNTATDAVLLGYLAGSGINSGSSVAIGRESLRSAYGASDGVYVGKYTGYQSNGTRAIALGYNSFRLAVGNLCVAVGEHTLYGSNGDSNVAVGQNALNSSTGGLNTAIGARAMLSATSVNSTAVGYQAGQGNSGDYVLALGHNAGNSNTQANRFIIGQQNLPQFAGAAAAAAALPAAGANGVYLYWDTTDNTIKARP